MTKPKHSDDYLIKTAPPTFDDLMDPDNESSVVFRTVGKLQEFIKNLPVQYLVPEDQLRQKFNFKPKREQHLLRVAFWQEYDRAMRTNSQMETLAIYKGIVVDGTRFLVYLEDPCFVSYMLLPVHSYKMVTEGIHNLALKQMYETLDVPHIDEDGKVDHKLLNQKLKIYKMMDDRIKGGVIQRQEIKAVSQINHTAEVRDVAMTPQQIEARIKEIEGDLKATPLLEAKRLE